MLIQIIRSLLLLFIVIGTVWCLFVREKPVNQINVIKPYKWEGLWVFDDPNKGLDKEALIAGMPEMIVMATTKAGIKNPEKGFLVLFSKDPFPGYMLALDWVGEENGGNVYEWKSTGMKGWLCPALFKYFDTTPKTIYIMVKE